MIFDALVLKVASRCNLNCSYCFMYNLGDTTYKKQPKFMSDTTVDNILKNEVATHYSGTLLPPNSSIHYVVYA